MPRKKSEEEVVEVSDAGEVEVALLEAIAEPLPLRPIEEVGVEAVEDMNKLTRIIRERASFPVSAADARSLAISLVRGLAASGRYR